MIITIDNKIQHLKELDYIERQLFGLLNPEQYYNDLGEFMFQSKAIDLKTKDYLTFEEMQAVDEFTRNYFNGIVPEAKTFFLRAYIIGRLLAESDNQGEEFKIDEVSLLPKYLQDAVKKYNLSIEEAKRFEQAVERGAVELSNTLSSTQQTVKNTLVEAVEKHEGIRRIEERLRGLADEVGELNRDWKRVAICETNDAFSNGYLSMMEEGEYVVGISMPDACPHCFDLLNGKVYKVRAEAPLDYSNLTGEEYNKIADIWENEIWVGKSNYGRSTAMRKRIDKHKGNTTENLTYREDHELSMPVIPLHPQCRCRWIAFNPILQWIDKDGNIRLKVEDPEAYKQWYNENILGY